MFEERLVDGGRTKVWFRRFAGYAEHILCKLLHSPVQNRKTGSMM